MARALNFALLLDYAASKSEISADHLNQQADKPLAEAQIFGAIQKPSA